MEVGMMGKPASDSTLPLIKMVDSLSSTVEKLATKIAKIEARSPASRDAYTHSTTVVTGHLSTRTPAVFRQMMPAQDASYFASTAASRDTVLGNVIFVIHNAGCRKTGIRLKGQVSGRPTVNLILSGIKMTALVDTGASCTLLRRYSFDLIVRRTLRACLS